MAIAPVSFYLRKRFRTLQASSKPTSRSWKNLACPLFAVALLVGGFSWAGESVPAPGTTVNETDLVVSSLDHLFQRTTVHRVETFPGNPNLLRLARMGEDGGVVQNVKWCGSKRLVFGYGAFHDDYDTPPPTYGGFMVDLTTRSVWSIRALGPDESLTDCSADGQWLIFRKKTKDNVIYSRYRLMDGKKEDFLRIPHRQETDSLVLSPDGRKYWLNEHRVEALDTSEPAWKPFPDMHKQHGEVRWFGDSSGILIASRNNLAVIKLDNPNHVENLVAPEGLFHVEIDRLNRVYAIEGLGGPEKKLRRCEIHRKELECQPVIIDDPTIVPVFDLTPEGRTIFYTENLPPREIQYLNAKLFGKDLMSPIQQTVSCLWQYNVASKSKKCLWEHGATYILHISPDARYIAFSSSGLNMPGENDHGDGLAVLKLAID